MIEGGRGTDAWRALAIEEYKALRDESLQAQRQQHSALQLGFSGLALLVGLSVAVRDRTVAAVVLLTAVPLLVTGTTLIWLNELRRMVRAGAFLVELEGRLNQTVPVDEPALSWETSLRVTRPHARLMNLYRAVFGALLGLDVLAAGAGIWLLVALDASLVLVVVAAPLEIAAAVALLDLFARFEVTLHDIGRGSYEGAAVKTEREDLSWLPPLQVILDLYATIRGRPHISAQRRD